MQGTNQQRTFIQGNSRDYIGMCWMGLFSRANCALTRDVEKSGTR